jgi:hypothetical protein
MTLSPIVLDYLLRVPCVRAFECYAGRIGEWWPAQYSRDAAGFAGVTIEPFVGGRVYASFRDGSTDDWSEVLAYEPGRLVRHTFTLAQSPDAPSELDVTFEPLRRTASGGVSEACTMHSRTAAGTSATPNCAPSFVSGRFFSIASRRSRSRTRSRSREPGGVMRRRAIHIPA